MALSEDDFYTAVHRTAWKRRSTGMMAGITLGLGLGLLIGCAVAFLPYLLATAGLSVVMTSGALVTSAPALGAIGASALTFGSVGAFTGMALGVDTGAAAGAVSAAFNVQQRLEGKDKERQSPGELAFAAKPRGAGEYLNPMVGIACAVLFGAFGALLALNPATAIVVGMLGLKAGTAAAIAASGITFGMMGATMGVNAPLITAELSNAYEKLVTGKVFEHTAATSVPLSVGKHPEKTHEAQREAHSPSPKTHTEKEIQTDEKTVVPLVASPDRLTQSDATPPWTERTGKSENPRTIEPKAKHGESHAQQLTAERAQPLDTGLRV